MKSIAVVVVIILVLLAAVWYMGQKKSHTQSTNTSKPKTSTDLLSMNNAPAQVVINQTPPLITPTAVLVVQQGGYNTAYQAEPSSMPSLTING